MNKNFAVIFDMDGVVVDNYQYHREAWMIFCNRYNLDFNRSFRSKVFGGTNRDHLETFFDRHLSDREIEQYEDEKEAIYRSLYRDHIAPVNGLASFLAALKEAGIPMGLATSSPPVNVHFVLNETNTGQYFRTILDASSITRGKPDPEIFLKAARSIGVDPSECIVFEDSVNGIIAARRAGMKVVGLTTTHKAEELPPVDLSIPDFGRISISDLENLL